MSEVLTTDSLARGLATVQSYIVQFSFALQDLRNKAAGLPGAFNTGAIEREELQMLNEWLGPFPLEIRWRYHFVTKQFEDDWPKVVEWAVSGEGRRNFGILPQKDSTQLRRKTVGRKRINTE